jgi:hypothetical protein
MPTISSYAMLGLTLACAACAAQTPPSARQSPLSIDVVWNEPGQVPPPFDDPNAVARQVLVTWNPRVFGAGEIDAIADGQCGAFDRHAHAIAAPSPAGVQEMQRFVCTVSAHDVADAGGERR